MNQTSIKKAAVKDLDVINEIFYLSKSSWGYSDEFMQQCMTDYSITADQVCRNSVYLFYVNELVEGFYSFSLNRDTQLYELDYFFLHPSCFGRGLGRKLWESCLQTAKLLNLTAFTLNSDPNAEGFYLQMGCKKIDEIESPIIKNRKLPVLIYRIA